MGTLRLTDLQLAFLIAEAELIRETGEGLIVEGLEDYIDIDKAKAWLSDKALEQVWKVFGRVMRNKKFASKVLRKAGVLLGSPDSAAQWTTRQLSKLIATLGLTDRVKPETMAGIMKWMARLHPFIGVSAGARWGFDKLANEVDGMTDNEWAEIWDAATGEEPLPSAVEPATSVDGPQAGDVMSTVTRSGEPRLVVVTDDLGDSERVQVRQYVGGKPVGAPYAVPRDRLADVGKERLVAGHTREACGTVTVLDEASLRREIRRVIRR